MIAETQAELYAERVAEADDHEQAASEDMAEADADDQAADDSNVRSIVNE
jgi:hypothetical protein